MKVKATFVVVLCFLCCVTAFGRQAAQGGAQAQRAPATETIAPNIPGVVAGGTKVQVIKDDFESAHGPIPLPDGSGMVIAELGASRLMKIGYDNKISTFLENTNGSLGLAFDPKGRLIANQTTPPGKTKIGVLYPKGNEGVLADSFEGKPFGRPNDLVVDKRGGVYFTDPGPNEAQIKAGYYQSGSAVYYIPSGGKAIKIAADIERPNGIQLSPDEKILYVANTDGDYLLAFDVQDDGTVRNRRNFAKTENGKAADADGLAIDGEGRIYLAAANGVQVFSPQGQHLGTIPVSRIPGSLAFGGPDKKTLYITGRAAAFKVQMLAQGFKGRAK